LVALYFQETPARFAEMRAALPRADGPGFARAAHSLKSTSRYVHGHALEKIAAELEKLADAGQYSELAEPLNRAEHLFSELRLRHQEPGHTTSFPSHENSPR
jgi:HPt (histidine-containing phosphotransfer) domain-containing protein